MNKECQKCQQLFEKPITRSRREWDKTMYCSHSCANSVNALRNGRQFVKGQESWNKGKKFPERSGENSPSWKGGDVTKQCFNCDVTFKRPLNRKGRTAKFCSKKCSYRARDEGKSTENEKLRSGVEFKLWRESVFFRDDWECQKCFKVGDYLHPHHIKNFAEYPELRFAIDNGITFCEDCHRVFHVVYGFRKNNSEQIEDYMVAAPEET